MTLKSILDMNHQVITTTSLISLKLFNVIEKDKSRHQNYIENTHFFLEMLEMPYMRRNHEMRFSLSLKILEIT